MTEARGNVSVDNDQVRVTTWTFEAAGAATDHQAVFVEIELKR